MKKMQATEREAVVSKEIHNFKQSTLNDKGVFLLDCGNEAFIWVGKKVQEKDRLYVYQFALQHIALLNQQSKDIVDRVALSLVESGFEPELFKTAFLGGWQNFEHASLKQSQTTAED